MTDSFEIVAVSKEDFIEEFPYHVIDNVKFESIVYVDYENGCDYCGKLNDITKKFKTMDAAICAMNEKIKQGDE